MKRPNQPLPSRPNSQAEWRKWLIHDVEFANNALKLYGKIDQMFVLHREREKPLLVQAGFYDGEHRRAVLNMMQMLCVAHDVRGFSCISEAWLKSVEDQAEAERIDRGEGVLPSQSDNRREVVSVNLIYRDGANERKSIGTVREIMRDAEARPSISTARIIEKDAALDPNFGGIPLILRAERPDEAEVTALKRLLDDHGKQALQALRMTIVEMGR